MLSGVKAGKRKRKSVAQEENPPTENKDTKSSYTSHVHVSSHTLLTENQNRRAADELRRMLQLPSDELTSKHTYSSTNPTSNPMDRFARRHYNDASGSSSTSRTHYDSQHHLKNNTSEQNHSKEKSDSKIIIVTKTLQPTKQKEDFKHGSRKGKKLKINGQSYLHQSEEEMKSIMHMMKEEKRGDLKSMDDVTANNILRLGSRYKGKEYNATNQSSTGADEEDYAGNGGMDMNMYVSNDSRLTASAIHAREMSRQISKVRKEDTISSKCFWWMESSSFQKHRLIALGDFVSLMMVPSHMSLVPDHCWLVPIQHSDAFVSCDGEVWDEVTRFKTSLQNMFEKEGKTVFFLETVFQSKGFWQTRMDVVPIPKNTEQDPEIAFKFAMEEQAEEWGTHTKVLSTKEKGVRYTIPKGFPYFNVEWNGGGYAQIIESEKFPKDFGLDILAGMYNLTYYVILSCALRLFICSTVVCACIYSTYIYEIRKK